MLQIVLVLFLGVGVSFGSEAKSDFTSLEKKISVSVLDSSYKKNGIDGPAKLFYDTALNIRDKYKDVKKNKKGLKVQDQQGKKFLIELVKTAEYISEHFDKGNLHYYGFAKLYKDLPIDLNVAIERSGLSVEKRNAMRATIKNNLE